VVSRGKSAPDHFGWVAALLAIAPARCLVIEDSEYGVLAVRTAGMRVCRFVGGSHRRADSAEGLLQASATLVFDDMAV
jgi:beta-phosphoglucomutase-like phosphatase (HAD superfamily)